MQLNTRMVVGIASLSVLLWAAVASAQDDELDRDDWNVSGEGNWSEDDNWNDFSGQLSGAPSLDLERWARVSNGGTAIVDDDLDTGALDLANGTVSIGAGNSLKVDQTSLTSGLTNIGGNGTLMVTGDGSFSGTSLTSTGTIHLGEPSAQFSLSGDLNHDGNLILGLTPNGGPALNVNGNAVVAGTVTAEITGDLALGTSVDFITGAASIDVSGARLALPETVNLERGVGALILDKGSSAAISITNLPILSINRQSGSAEFLNVIGDTLPMTGYSLFSDNGLLQQSGWNSLAAQGVTGWEEANPRDDALAEINLTGASDLVKDAAGLSIGSPYKAGNVAPADEDVEVLVSFANGAVLNGLVEYTGAPNALTLRVDPDTGDAEISNQSQFLDPADVTGYSILSASGGLTAENWTSIADAVGDASWFEANPGANAIAEISPSGSLLFSNGTEHQLGGIFTVGSPLDLTFEFTTAGSESVITGFVEYGKLDEIIGEVCIPVNELEGDLNGDGTVAFADFLVLSTNFNQQVSRYEDGDINCDGTVAFADFLILSTNFNKTLGTSLAGVPEPSCVGLMCLGTLGLFVTRRRRR